MGSIRMSDSSTSPSALWPRPVYGSGGNSRDMTSTSHCGSLWRLLLSTRPRPFPAAAVAPTSPGASWPSTELTWDAGAGLGREVRERERTPRGTMLMHTARAAGPQRTALTEEREASCSAGALPVCPARFRCSSHTHTVHSTGVHAVTSFTGGWVWSKPQWNKTRQEAARTCIPDRHPTVLLEARKEERKHLASVTWCFGPHTLLTALCVEWRRFVQRKRQIAQLFFFFGSDDYTWNFYSTKGDLMGSLDGDHRLKENGF